MATPNRKRKVWYLAPIGVSMLVLVIALLALYPPQDWPLAVVRGAALLGYLLTFAAILSSMYMREMMRLFGYPYLKIHHIASVTGLILITIHPIALALVRQSMGVFVPVLTSLRAFFTNGGRPAWYLFVLAALVAWRRRDLASVWKRLHYLSYLAFWLATAHAFLLGEDFQRPAVRVLAVLLGLIVVVVFVQKRVVEPRRVRRG